MKDFKAILAAYSKIGPAETAALATVVKVRGSSYRSPGARMLITGDGRWFGSISGGCLEGDALRKARRVMSEGKPVTVTYDTGEESNQNLGIGLGCNGVIDVLIEPIQTNVTKSPVDLFVKLAGLQEPMALATLFSGPASGDKTLIDVSGQPHSTFQDSTLTDRVMPDLVEVFQTHRSGVKTYETADGPVEVFVELIQPSISLLIFGGGFDSRPVTTLASSLGWDVTVTDECVAHIAPVFFPAADRLSLCQREFIEREFKITPFTACVLMSHNYEYDRDVLRKLIDTPTPYIGILGPRKRFEKILEEFNVLGIQTTKAQLDRIHSPIGLDIGAEAPDEIAVAIVAEIQARFSNRSGGPLKNNSGPIHVRDGEEVYKQTYKV